MREPGSIQKLAPALVAAQAELRAVAKDRKNDHFKNSYATLDAIIESVRPVLAAHGLAITQGATEAIFDNNATLKAFNIETLLIHESGEFLVNAITIPVAKADPQGAVSCCTYGRRAGISALLALATEDDDDGNAASRPPAAAKRAPAPKQQPVAPPERQHTPPPPKWLGLAKERPMPFGNTKGKPLGEHSKEHLESLAKWCLNRPGFEDFLRDVRRVLADISLGVDTVPDTADRIVAKMHADTEKDEAPLTALLESTRK